MLQPAGDLGLGDEPLAADRVVGVLLEDLLKATSRCSSPSSATKTAPRPPRACGRRMRNRCPSEVAEPTAMLAVRSGSSSSASVAGPFLLRATRASVASISGSPRLRQAVAGGAVGGNRGQALLDRRRASEDVVRQALAAARWRRSGRPRSTRMSARSRTCRASTPERRPRAGPGQSCPSEVRAVQREDGDLLRRPWGGSGARRHLRHDRPRPRSPGSEGSVATRRLSPQRMDPG